MRKQKIPEILPAVPLEDRTRKKGSPSEEKRRQAVDLFRHGIGYTKASRILDLSVNTVREWHREFKKGTFRVKVSTNQYRYPKDVRENVIRMRLSGISWAELTKRTGISASTARKWVNDYCSRRGVRPQLLVPGIRSDGGTLSSKE